MRLKKLDARFLRSNDGKRLVKEWKDVGRVLKNNIRETKRGLHLNNRAMPKLSKELDDVSDHYEYLGTTHWDGKYKRAYKRLFTAPTFKKVKFAAHRFKHSVAGKMLKKEVKEFGGAIKKNLKVTDVPKKWKKNMNGLRIGLDEEGAEEIRDQWM